MSRHPSIWRISRVSVIAIVLSLSHSVVSPFIQRGAQADVPRKIHYQGKLTEQGGSPLVGERTVTLRLYATETGGAKLWEEAHTLNLARDDNGIFSVVLGSEVPFGSRIPFNEALWLTTEIDGTGEFSPRQPLSAVTYAINADLLDGLDSKELIASAAANAGAGVAAGAGLTSSPAGGTTTLRVGAGPGIVVTEDAVGVDAGSGAGKIVQLDADGALPAVSGVHVTDVNASALSSGIIPEARFPQAVSLLGSSIDASEIVDGTLTTAETTETFLTAGSGITVTRVASSWQIDATGAGGVSALTAGAGLLGGGTSETVTLDVGAGPGVLVTDDAVSVDVGTGPNQIVQLDATGSLPAVSGAEVTNVNAAHIASGTMADERLSTNVSLLGHSIESAEVTDGTLTADDTTGTFLTAGEGATVTKGAGSWQIAAVGSGGDITGVAAGVGLIGGGTSGAVTLALSLPVPIAHGGTGAADAAAALANLGGAARGTNSDLTSLSGLTIPLSVNQGGTGATALSAGGVLIGQGGAPVTTTGVLPKGTVIVGDGAGEPSVIAAGADGTILTADASQASGVKWAAGGDVAAVGDCETGACFTANGAGNTLSFEGQTVDSNENLLTSDDPTGGDGTFRLPNLAGTSIMYVAVDLLSVTSLGGQGLEITNHQLHVSCLPVGGVDETNRSATFEVAAFGGGTTGGRADRLWPAPVAGTMKTLYAFVGQAPGIGKSWTVTLRKNAANTNVSCVIAGSAQSCSTSAVVSIEAGDRLGVAFVKAGNAAGTQGGGWSACLVPD